MTPHEFFRHAAQERRTALIGLAVTDGKSTLREVVLSELPVQDTSQPHPPQIRYDRPEPDKYHLKN